MKITVFTSNQPRHVSLIDALSAAADRVYAIQECSTVYPGMVADFFGKSEVMRRYFSHVMKAEREIFGPPRFPRNFRGNVTQMAIKMGDLNFLSPADLGEAMGADLFVVFGSSYIRGELCGELVKRPAINIHMGIAPQYRGSSCNFWALYDRRPDLVGATLHLLSSGLDSGKMIRHALPPGTIEDGFVLGMASVASAHEALVELIRSGRDYHKDAIPQERTRQIRYTRNADFTDAAAGEYLSRLPPAAEIRQALGARAAGAYLRPHIPAAIPQIA
jgi:hypothetical protein